MTPTEADPCLYVRSKERRLDLVILIYVDDILIMGVENETLNNAKTVLGAKFKMNDMGGVKRFLGMNITVKPEGVFITQRSYIEKVFERFIMANCKIKSVPLSPSEDFKRMAFPSDTNIKTECPYRELVGCLL